MRLIIMRQHPGLNETAETMLPELRSGQDAFKSGWQFRVWHARQKRQFGATLLIQRVPLPELQKYLASAQEITRRNLRATGLDDTDPRRWR